MNRITSGNLRHHDQHVSDVYLHLKQHNLHQHDINLKHRDEHSHKQLNNSNSDALSVQGSHESFTSRNQCQIKLFSKYLTALEVTTFSETTTVTGTSTTASWCSKSDGDQARKDTWCPSGVDSDSDLPFYADVELSDTGGVLLLDVFSVQLSLNGSSPLAFRFPNDGRLILLVPERLVSTKVVFSNVCEIVGCHAMTATLAHFGSFLRRSIFFVWAMAEIFSPWVDSWQELHKLSNVTHVLRDWLTETSTVTTSSTLTHTSTTATTTTSTRLVQPFPAPLHTSGLLLGALELAFSDPLEAWDIMRLFLIVLDHA